MSVTYRDDFESKVEDLRQRVATGVETNFSEGRIESAHKEMLAGIFQMLGLLTVAVAAVADQVEEVSTAIYKAVAVRPPV